RGQDDGGVDAHHPVPRVHEGATGVTRVQGRVRLDHIVDQAPADRSERAAQRAHDTGGHGALEPERIPYRHDQLTHTERPATRVAELGDGDGDRRNPDHGEIGAGVVSHEVRVDAVAVGERDLETGRVVDHMAV